VGFTKFISYALTLFYLFLLDLHRSCLDGNPRIPSNPVDLQLPQFPSSPLPTFTHFYCRRNDFPMKNH